jgi:hypothetical protein
VRCSLKSILFALLMGAAAGCAQTTQPPAASAEPGAVTLGSCFGAGGVGCQSDSGCRPPFLRCQRGSCCSGEIDAKTCACHCAGGPACGPGQWCCKGDPHHVPPVEKQGALMCRPQNDCLDNGP